MDQDHYIWRQWAKNLHRWGLSSSVSALLDILDPLAFLGAQFLYIGQPFLKILTSEENIYTVARLLEVPENRNGFIHLLQEETSG